MPSPPLLDFESLLKPIPGGNPAGAVPHRVRDEVEVARKKADDPKLTGTARKSAWGRVLDLARENLASSSKDLKLAAFLTEALTKLHGFAGLRDGLTLLRL